VEGNKRVETDAILAVIESRKGTKYDPAALNKDLRSIYAMGFFEDIQIDTEETPGGKNVTFRVSEKPSITKITLLGTERIDQEDLMEVLGIKKYSIMNRNAIKDSVKRYSIMNRNAIKDSVKRLRNFPTMKSPLFIR